MQGSYLTYWYPEYKIMGLKTDNCMPWLIMMQTKKGLRIFLLLLLLFITGELPVWDISIKIFFSILPSSKNINSNLRHHIRGIYWVESSFQCIIETSGYPLCLWHGDIKYDIKLPGSMCRGHRLDTKPWMTSNTAIQHNLTWPGNS